MPLDRAVLLHLFSRSNSQKQARKSGGHVVGKFNRTDHTYSPILDTYVRVPNPWETAEYLLNIRINRASSYSNKTAGAKKRKREKKRSDKIEIQV